MKITFTKRFYFSASFSNGGRVYGHNYTLGVTTDAMDENFEIEFEKKIEDSLIKKLQTRDLGLDVDFLKGAHINDANLLKIFWGILKKEIQPAPLYSLSLERDGRTQTVMSVA